LGLVAGLTVGWVSALMAGLLSASLAGLMADGPGCLPTFLPDGADG
jgi:hypothetical protein